MILILEGADLTGKTSVAHKLSELTGIPQTGIWIDLKTPKPAVISVAKTLIRILTAIRPNIIFDRSFMSEYVYGNILGRETSYIPPLIEEWKSIPNCRLIILTASDKILEERYYSRGDGYMCLTDIIKVNNEYQRFEKIISQYIDTHIIDTSDLTIDQLAIKILGMISRREIKIQ